MILAVAFELGAATVHAQSEGEGGGAGLSRSMRAAVRFYEQGNDIQALDRFMEILTKGAPSERALANEYLNLITRRMNTRGGASGSPAAKGTDTKSVPMITEGTVAPARLRARDDVPVEAAAKSTDTKSESADPGKAASPASREPAGAVCPQACKTTAAEEASSERPRARSEDMPAANKVLMRKEIRARLRSAVEKSLSDLKSIEGVRAVMRENGDPEALGIPANLLFQSGIAFQRDASRILDPLTKLIFALGATSAVILPEGTSIGDAKVMDMRRTMGISAHLFNAGVAPPRVRVNLLNTQVDIPRGLQDFKGVVIVFVYNQPLPLVVESAMGDEMGPPISLGVYPSAFRPSRGQGTIIEFSVSDPPTGLLSWKFQLLQPSRDGSELTPLQNVVGGGPVFHQIFWNGKQNYFGEVLPAGRYECVLTAVDDKNRRRALHRWIQILDDEVVAEKLLAEKGGEGAAAPAAPIASVEAVILAPMFAPSADLGGEQKPLVAGVKAAGGKRSVVKRPARGKKAGKGRAIKASEPQPAAAGDEEKTPPQAAVDAASTAGAAVSHWELVFNSGTYQLTPSSEKLLAEVAAAVPKHPLGLRVTGHSGAAEADGAALAGQRAKMVAGILVNRYMVDSKRIFMNSAASGAGPKVDLEFARSE